MEESGEIGGVGVEDAEGAENDDAAGAEVSVLEGAEVDEGVFDARFAIDQAEEAGDEEEGERLDAVKGIAEPIPFLSFAEEDFPTRHGDGEEAKAKGVEALVLFAECGALDGEVFGVFDEGGAKKECGDADGEVEVEDPLPAVIVGDVPAERWADDGGEECGHAEEGHGESLFFLGEGVEEDGLGGGLESAAGEALEDAEGDEHVEAGGHSAEGGGEGEDGDGEEEVVAAAEARADPAGDGEDDGVGGEVAGDDPFAVGGGSGEAAGDVAEGDVGDGGVEDFHEGGDDDGEGDEPGAGGA